MLRSQLAKVLFAKLCFLVVVAPASSQDNKVMGEVRFEGATKVEKGFGLMADM